MWFFGWRGGYRIIISEQSMYSGGKPLRYECGNTESWPEPRTFWLLIAVTSNETEGRITVTRNETRVKTEGQIRLVAIWGRETTQNCCKIVHSHRRLNHLPFTLLYQFTQTKPFSIEKEILKLILFFSFLKLKVMNCRSKLILYYYSIEL